jgi:AcrR family transcriptional regulator
MTNITGGRINQKLRTRNALVDAASELLRAGQPFTVNDVADIARVGRTTAYRYFPTGDALVTQATVHAINLVGDQNLGKQFEAVDEPEQRLKLVVDSGDAGIREHERLYRTMLRLSLSDNADDVPGGIQRSELREQIIDRALADLKKTLGAKRYHMLTAALNVFIGIEAHVVLTDVNHLDLDQAYEVKLWATKLLLQAALAEAEAGRQGRAARVKAASPGKAASPAKPGPKTRKSASAGNAKS